MIRIAIMKASERRLFTTRFPCLRRILLHKAEDSNNLISNIFRVTVTRPTATETAEQPALESFLVAHRQVAVRFTDQLRHDHTHPQSVQRRIEFTWEDYGDCCLASLTRQQSP